MRRPVLLRIDGPSTPAELREHSSRAVDEGFDGAEWGVPAGFVPSPTGTSNFAGIHVRALALRCEGLDVSSVARSLSLHLEAAASLGAQLLNWGVPPLRRGRDAAGFARYQDALSFAYEVLHRVRLEAEAAGVAVALEAADGGCFLSPIELRELIDAVNSPAVGACLDVQRIAAIGSPWDWIGTLHRRVQAVRLVDFPCAANRETQAGPAAFDAVVGALDDLGSPCPVIVFGRGIWRDQREWLRDPPPVETHPRN